MDIVTSKRIYSMKTPEEERKCYYECQKNIIIITNELNIADSFINYLIIVSNVVHRKELNRMETKLKGSQTEITPPM